MRHKLFRIVKLTNSTHSPEEIIHDNQHVTPIKSPITINFSKKVKDGNEWLVLVEHIQNITMCTSKMDPDSYFYTNIAYNKNRLSSSFLLLT